MHPIAIGGLALLIALTASSIAVSPGGAAPDRGPEPEPHADPSADPEAVLQAYIEAIASQGTDPGPLQRLIGSKLTVLPEFPGGYAAVLMPCDQTRPGLFPTSGLLNRIADAIAESYGVETSTFALKWNHESTGSILMCAVAFYFTGSPEPTESEVISRFTKRLTSAVTYGAHGLPSTDSVVGHSAPVLPESFGFIDLVLNTIISSAVGTVTSMAVQDMVHAAGGERKLGRLVRRYKKAKAAGGKKRAEHLLDRLAKTSSRIKNRLVTTDEVDALIESM